MTVNDVGTVLPCHRRDRPAQRRPEAGGAMERGDRNVIRIQLRGPVARFIEAADSHRNLTGQSPCEFDDETFGPAGIEAENDLKNPRFSHGGCRSC